MKALLVCSQLQAARCSHATSARENSSAHRPWGVIKMHTREREVPLGGLTSHKIWDFPSMHLLSNLLWFVLIQLFMSSIQREVCLQWQGVITISLTSKRQGYPLHLMKLEIQSGQEAFKGILNLQINHWNNKSLTWVSGFSKLNHNMPSPEQVIVLLFSSDFLLNQLWKTKLFGYHLVIYTWFPSQTLDIMMQQKVLGVVLLLNIVLIGCYHVLYFKPTNGIRECGFHY